MTNDEMITRLESVVAELTKDLDTMTKVANDEGLTISQIEYAYSVDKEVMDAEIERLTQRARELETQLKDEEETYYNAWKCGWCNERFPTPAEAMDHALSCETHPLVQRVKELEDANRWIPVSERLPEETGWYETAVVGLFGKIEQQYFGDGKWYFDDTYYWRKREKLPTLPEVEG